MRLFKKFITLITFKKLSKMTEELLFFTKETLNENDGSKRIYYRYVNFNIKCIPIMIKTSSMKYVDRLYKTYDDNNPIHEFWWKETEINENDLYMYYYSYMGPGYKELINAYVENSNKNWTDCMKFSEYGNHTELIEFFINKGADYSKLGPEELKNYIRNLLLKSFLISDIIDIILDYY